MRSVNEALRRTDTHDERGRTDYKDTAGGRLDYGYYANNLLKDTVSSNSGGVNVGYRYDDLNRLTAQSPGSWLQNPGSNHCLYCGEQFDADLGLYYNRARYLNTDSGRFWSMDGYEGKPQDPESLHKYVYASANPVAFRDPTGQFSIGELNITQAINSIIDKVKDTKFVRWYFSRLGPKVFEIFFGTNGNGHDFIYAKNIAGGTSWRYDIFLRGKMGIPGLSGLPPWLLSLGTFTLRPDSKFSSPSGGLSLVGALSQRQFLVWNALIVPIGYAEAAGGGGEAPVLFSVLGVPPLTNCTKWSYEAAGAARIVSLLPLG